MVDQKAKIERYKALQAEYLAKGAIAELKLFVQHIVSEDVPLVASRQVLQELATALPKLAPEQLKEIGLFAVEQIHPRVTSFEEQAATIREALAALYEVEEDWTAAAKMLAGIPLDSGIRVLEDNSAFCEDVHLVCRHPRTVDDRSSRCILAQLKHGRYLDKCALAKAEEERHLSEFRFDKCRKRLPRIVLSALPTQPHPEGSEVQNLAFLQTSCRR